MTSRAEQELTELENGLLSDLWNLQHGEKRATEIFAVSEALFNPTGTYQLTQRQTATETYVRSMTDDAKRRKQLLTDYIELKKVRQETKHTHDDQNPYVVVLLDGNCSYVSLSSCFMETCSLTDSVQG